MPILVGIDGTGTDAWGSDDPSRKKLYDRDFENSFVQRICRPGSNTIYLEGPGWVPAANGLQTAILTGVKFIREKRRAGVDEPILLTGYSRGAAGAISIAQWLNLGMGRDKVNVDAMLLFDCVNRDLATDTDTIPANVGYVLHVMRSDAARSRVSFGHSGTERSPGSRTDNKPWKRDFYCTHGAMGGTPWLPPIINGQRAKLTDYISEGPGAWIKNEPTSRVTYEQDASGAEQVQSFIKPFMREHGFPIPPDVIYSALLKASHDGSLESIRATPEPTRHISTNA